MMIKLLVILSLTTVSLSTSNGDFHLFYFVQQVHSHLISFLSSIIEYLALFSTVFAHFNFLFFLFVFGGEKWQWLGSYCDQKGTRCCYPPTGKPKPDFTVYGLWPYYNDGTFPYNCGSDNFDEAIVIFLHFLPIFCTI